MKAIEHLVQAVQSSRKGSMGSINNVYVAQLDVALVTEAAQELAALSWARWIPVAERLPEDRQDVLVLTDDNDCSTGRWNEAVKRWDIKYSNQQFFRTYFVYWMPLPPAPETEGTK